MIWNDMSGRLDVGISEVDMYDRFFDPLGVISGKLWGMEKADAISGGEILEELQEGVSEKSREESFKEYEQFFSKLGCAPGSNPYALKVWEEDSFDLIEGIKTKKFQAEIDNIITSTSSPA